ncbi:MAG: hypothetical protein ABGX12_02730 [Desulfurobacteriaceae bacterium]
MVLWDFYIARYKNERKWKKHIEKHVEEYLQEENLPSPPVGEEVFFRDVNLTLLFGGRLRLVIFEPADYKKKLVFFNERTKWLLIALPEQKLILTAFYLKVSSTPEEYFCIEKGYTEITPEIDLEELRNGPKEQGYYRRPTEEEEEFLHQIRSQCKYVGC